MLAALVAAAVLAGPPEPDPRLTQWQLETLWGIPHAGRARNYQTMRQVWGQVRDHFPGRAMPMPYFQHPKVEAGIWKDHRGQLRGYGWNPEFQGKLTSKKATERSDAVDALLHEWAHNFQKPELLYEDQLPAVEGGAVAFAANKAPAIAQRFGFRYIPPRVPKQYQEWANQVLAERGVDWVLRDQFFTT